MLVCIYQYTCPQICVFCLNKLVSKRCVFLWVEYYGTHEMPICYSCLSGKDAKMYGIFFSLLLGLDSFLQLLYTNSQDRCVYVILMECDSFQKRPVVDSLC